MKSDLVARLRETSGQYDDHGWHSEIELEAANYIEELEKRMEQARVVFMMVGREMTAVRQVMDAFNDQQ